MLANPAPGEDVDARVELADCDPVDDPIGACVPVEEPCVPVEEPCVPVEEEPVLEGGVWP